MSCDLKAFHRRGPLLTRHLNRPYYTCNNVSCDFNELQVHRLTRRGMQSDTVGYFGEDAAKVWAVEAFKPTAERLQPMLEGFEFSSADSGCSCPPYRC